jgi:hypothetical protein
MNWMWWYTTSSGPTFSDHCTSEESVSVDFTGHTSGSAEGKALSCARRGRHASWDAQLEKCHQPSHAGPFVLACPAPLDHGQDVSSHVGSRSELVLRHALATALTQDGGAEHHRSRVRKSRLSRRWMLSVSEGGSGGPMPPGQRRCVTVIAEAREQVVLSSQFLFPLHLPDETHLHRKRRFV